MNKSTSFARPPSSNNRLLAVAVLAVLSLAALVGPLLYHTRGQASREGGPAAAQQEVRNLRNTELACSLQPVERDWQPSAVAVPRYRCCRLGAGWRLGVEGQC